MTESDRSMADRPMALDRPVGWDVPLSLSGFTAPKVGEVVFYVDNDKEILRFEPDGRIYVHGNLVETDKSVVEAFRKWLAVWVPNGTYLCDRCREEIPHEGWCDECTRFLLDENAKHRAKLAVHECYGIGCHRLVRGDWCDDCKRAMFRALRAGCKPAGTL